MKLLKAMTTVAGFTFLSRIFGFIRDMLTAIIMGAGPLADAFFVALKLPNLFRRISAEGAFTVAFIPIFAETIEKDGKDEALRMVRNMMGYMCFILAIFSALAIVFMPYIIQTIAPGFEVGGERHQAASYLARITFPYLLFISLSALLGGIMNSVGRFGVYAFLPVLFNLSLIGALLSHDVLWNSPAQSLAYGVAIAGLLQFAWIFIYAAKHGWLVYPTFPKLTLKVKKLFALMLPGILGAGVYHLNIFADMVIASFLEEGSISYLYYADRLQQLPLGVGGIAVGTALLPLLSKSLVAEKFEEANQHFNRALEACLLLALPAATALIIAAKPIIMGLFNYGAFTNEDANITAFVLTCYAVGLPVYIVAKVFQSACFAKQDTKTPVKISMICALTNIIFGVMLSQVIGVAGIALATAISGFIQVTLLYRITKNMDYLSFDGQLKRNAMKIITSCLIMAGVLFAYTYALGDLFLESGTTRIFALTGLVGAGGALYLLSIMISGVMSIHNIKNILVRKKA